MSLSKDLFNLDDDTPVVSISASQSLASASNSPPIPTGLTRLDESLSDCDRGGIPRGQITEIFGPPAAGKTSFALNVASHAIRDGGTVVWIGPPLPIPRLNNLKQSELTQIIHFQAPTLPHLLALLMRPPSTFPPPSTTLIVIDSISSHFPAYFPNAADLKDQLSSGKVSDKNQLQWLLNRKWNVASDLAACLSKLATASTSNGSGNGNGSGTAVLVINQTHTKIRNQPRATLHPIVSGGNWESHIQNRLVVYRDLPDARFVEVVKKAGRTLTVRLPDMIVSFRVTEDGLKEINPEDDLLHSPVFQRSEVDITPSRKRKAENEIADSQDEDDDSEAEYQWDESLLEGDDAGKDKHQEEPEKEEKEEQEKEKGEEGEGEKNDKTAENE